MYKMLQRNNIKKAVSQFYGPEDVQRKAYAIWEEKGKPAQNTDEQNKDYQDAERLLQIADRAYFISEKSTNSSEENYRQATIIHNFNEKNYKTKYTDVGFANFHAEYVPNNKMLKVDLPVYFNKKGENGAPLDFPPNEETAFIDNVKKTWSEKYQLMTHGFVKRPEPLKSLFKGWEALNPVKVEVTSRKEANEANACFKMSFAPAGMNHGTYIEPGGAMLEADAWTDTNDAWNNTGLNYNVLGHEVGHMFGLDDEYQIGNGDYVIENNITAYDKIAKTTRTYVKADANAFKHENIDYKIHKVAAADVIAGGNIKIKGVDYSVGAAPYIDDFILLDETHKKRSDALSGTHTDHYGLTEKAFGTKHAEQNAIMDDSINDTIMGDEKTVKKHHYVTFWDAMVKAIQKDYNAPPSDKAPNQHEDWEIQ